MGQDEKQELARFRWQIDQIQRLVETWHADESSSDDTLTCARQIEAILKAKRPPLVVLLPAILFFIIVVLILALILK